MNPPQQICTAINCGMFCFASLVNKNDDTIYSDVTGCFPVCLFSGMNYIFIAYVYTINVILIKPMETMKDMKAMADNNMVAIFKEIYEELEE